MSDIIKILNRFEVYDLMIKVVTQTFKHEMRKQRVGCFNKLFGTLGATLLGNFIS